MCEYVDDTVFPCALMRKIIDGRKICHEKWLDDDEWREKITAHTGDFSHMSGIVFNFCPFTGASLTAVRAK